MVRWVGSAFGRCWLAVALLLVGCDPPERPDDLAFAVCANAECEPGENAVNCLADCGPCAKAPNCDDNDPCTQDSCEPTSGCYHKPLTGTACPDDGPCKVESRCAAGQCVGKERFWQRTVPAMPDSNDWIAAVTVEGGKLLAVGRQVKDEGFGNHHELFFLRVATDNDSSAAPPTQVPITSGNDDDIVGGIAPLSEGRALVVGERVETGAIGPAGPFRRAQWYKIGPADPPSVDPAHLEVAGHHGLRDVARGLNGNLLAVGWVNKQGLAMRFAADGAVGAKMAVETPGGKHGELQAVAGLAGAGGGFVAVGNLRTSDKDWHGWAVRLPAVGTATDWNVEVPAPLTKQGELRAVVAMADGGAVAMGTVGSTPPYIANPGGSTVWLVRFSAAGKVEWSRTSDLGQGPIRLLWLPAANSLVAVCAIAPGGTSSDRVLLRFDPTGQLTGSSTVPLGWPYAAVALPDGTLGFAGSDTSTGKNDSWIARTDAWGHTGCEPKCAAVPMGGCADGNACTFDSCSPAKGCQTSPAPKATSCGPSSTCKETQCVSDLP